MPGTFGIGTLSLHSRTCVAESVSQITSAVFVVYVWGFTQPRLNIDLTGGSSSREEKTTDESNSKTRGNIETRKRKENSWKECISTQVAPAFSSTREEAEELMK